MATQLISIVHPLGDLEPRAPRRDAIPLNDIRTCRPGNPGQILGRRRSIDKPKFDVRFHDSGDLARTRSGTKVEYLFGNYAGVAFEVAWF